MARRRVKAAEWLFDGEHFIWAADTSMTTHQLAEVIGNTHQAVTQSEKRAKQKLRKKLTERRWDEKDGL